MKKINNEILIKNVYAKQNKIYYEYEITGTEEFKKIFWLGELFTVEYNSNIENVPESILIIPLMCNILPIAWVNNAKITCNEIDYNFYKCIKKIKNEYKKMLPKVKLEGKVCTKKKVKNKSEIFSSKTAILFSGGVDSFGTLITHLQKKPDLVTICGADIDFENENGWKNVKEFVCNIGNEFDLTNILIKASIRRFIDNSELEKQFHKLLNDDWWHAMQHGIGLIGNLLPYMYKNNINKVYIPSTFKKNTKVVNASNAEIVEALKCSNIQVVYDNELETRQEKVNTICRFCKDNKKKLALRVCYRSLEGKNCCNCEKCYRSIMAIIANKMDPNDFGFEYSKEKLQQIRREVSKDNYLTNTQRKLWKEIKNELLKENEYWKNNEEVNWLINMDL